MAVTQLGPLPRPLSTLPPARLAALLGVMTDIDDTLTCEGAIVPAALAALHALHAAGVPVIAITGRPLGWSMPFAAAWPVAAIVAENGGVALLRDGDRVRVEYADDEATRHRQAQRLRAVAARVQAEVPGARQARDSDGRVTDIAIDHAEHAQLAPAAVARVLALMRAAGMQASVSSIHVNGWFGSHSKWTAAQWMVRRLYGRTLDDEIERWLCVGDSPNDQPLFERFPLAVGVANLRLWSAQLHTWPPFVTDAERGEGFAEVARAVLAARA